MHFSVGHSTIFIAEKYHQTPKDHWVVYDSASMETVYNLAKSLLASPAQPSQNFLFYVSSVEKSLQELGAFFDIVHSAGGIVEAENKLLFIKRKGRWDLPKGKVEAGEDYPTAAVREILEETAVESVVRAHLHDTWHAYNDFGPLTLKCTHWFWLTALTATQTQPQASEGILQAEWLTPRLVSEVLEQSFPSIKEVVAAYELRKF